MKISLDWLSDFIEFKKKDPQVIAQEVTAHAAEVDEVQELGALLKHCCVGKIMSLAKHPNADRLNICEVKTDHGTKKVVCGGTNLRVGMRIAFAHSGATVKHGKEMMTLEKMKIRGEESDGMICASEELALEDRFPPKASEGSRPIVDLGDGDDGVGKDLRSYLNLSDTVLHIDNHAITHRADLFSHVGFARECVAMGIATWKKEPELPTFKFPKTALPFALKVENSKLMPRYCACLIAIDSLGETPDWMKKRLTATGWRPVNLPVDITNYVMMEIGVPLHSFDAGDIVGDVTMRGSKKGEKIVTLDKSELTLPEGALILEDTKGIFDLLGIMGGLRSSTKNSTRHIYLHSASLDPVSIRRAVIATGHRTDAATVYEKGVPPVITEHGFFRALELMLEFIPGATIASKLESKGDNGKPKAIDIAQEKITRMLGAEIPAKKIEKIFKDLGFTVKTKSTNAGTSFLVTAPLHRVGDIRGEHDLVEEVGRIYGFNEIDAEMPLAELRVPARDPRLHRFRDTLKAESYTEILPLSLIGVALLKKAGLDAIDAIEVQNPIGEELSLMQTSTLPGLLEHAGKNLGLTEHTLKTFTIAHVFSKNVPEHTECGLLIAEKKQRGIKEDPFLVAKDHLGAALSSIGFAMAIEKPKRIPACAHPGRAAEVSVQGSSVGWIFELHPSVRARFDLPERVAVALLDCSALIEKASASKVAKPLPTFPAITYDVTVPLSGKTEMQKILESVRGCHEFLEEVAIVDLYASASQKNVTMRFTYRAEDRTLTEQEVQKVHEGLVKGMKN
ncbi:phenylalanine--tRNA ligase subunit beta [Candidatus Peribacteria bacterium RIFCSPHIGHO2_02_FULL_52_16]|nr:MAG: phenylalanine--tRNA ligase subunit beta [Candidatus Peribacteria bacterium RIFCSPHIGHO2_01_FULL_51_35]OGJ60956.1 MAG: phenylalanine--tRNA ligase subunit beta [Candidatus Peribacteria bacterium RIFCSPHIGHO2_02_FULL_52_16]